MTNLYQDLADAFLDALRADTGLTVYDGKVPDPFPAPPYVLVYLTIPRPLANPHADLRNRSDGRLLTAYCHCVGLTGEAARAVGARVEAAVLGVTLTVAGLTLMPVRQSESLPPVRNEDTGEAVMDLVQVYEAWAGPA